MGGTCGGGGERKRVEKWIRGGAKTLGEEWNWLDKEPGARSQEWEGLSWGKETHEGDWSWEPAGVGEGRLGVTGCQCGRETDKTEEELKSRKLELG